MGQTPHSVAEFARVERRIGDSEFCFVVMSLQNNPILESYYEEAIKPAVLSFKLKCLRVDQEHFTGSITTKIRDNIDNARIVIVDTTSDRPNCYFEAGYAVARDKDIIWQRLNAPPFSGADLQFDIKDYPHILYTTIRELKTRLKEKIKFLLNNVV